jgi:hypothetical protein
MAGASKDDTSLSRVNTPLTALRIDNLLEIYGMNQFLDLTVVSKTVADDGEDVYTLQSKAGTRAQVQFNGEAPEIGSLINVLEVEKLANVLGKVDTWEYCSTLTAPPTERSEPNERGEYYKLRFI